MKRILAIMTIIVLCFSEFSILAPQVKAPETVIFFDDFDDIYLKPEWIWVDPWEDCSYSLDWDPGYLTIDVPYDGNDLWTYSNVDAPRMVQSANGDFIIETMVVFNPQYSSQGAGILVWKDSDNYLRLDRLLHGEADQVVDFSGEMAGEWFYLAEMSYSDIITYLRLERTAGLFTASYSGDGTNWDFLGEIVSELSDPVEIGLFALNQWQNNPVYADFDYFKVSVAGVPQGGLVGYWRFDEGSGTTAADSSGSGNMGDLRNGPAWVEGRRGEALRFDGVDDYATINENTDLDPHTSDWTVSAWVNIGALVGGGYTPYGFVIVGKRQAESDSSLTLLAHWGTSPTSQAMFGFLFDGSNQAAGARSPLMNVFGWHYVVGVRRGGDLYVYVDGAEYGPNNFFERGTNLTANTDVSSSTPIHFAHHGAWQLYYNGTLDDVRIYSRALSQQQIEADMNSHVGYWKFDEGSGSVAADSSGMGNDGTLDGPVWTNGKQGKALDFDGINDYVWIEASNSLDVTSQVTVEAWVYPRSYVSSTGDAPHIVSRADSSGGSIYILAIRTGAPKVEYAVNPFPDAHQSTATLQLDAWTHLAMTYDGSYVRLYINGGFDSSYSLSGSIDTTDNWLAMGCKPAAPSGGSAFFNGTIDEVRIYSRALNQHEIQEDIIASVSANIITEWSIPVVVTSGVPGSSIITDSLGNIWFALQTKDAGYSSVVKFEPTISRFTTYDLRGGISDQCWGLDIDSTGKLWFAMATGIAGTFEWGGIGVLNPATSTVHEYKNPLGGTWGGRDYIGLTVDKNDRVWITGSFSNTIQMFDPVTLNYTVWSYPGSNGWNVYPYLTVTSDGSVWFPEVLSNRIAKLVPSTSVFTEYTVPPEIGSFSDISCVTVQVDSSGTIGFNEPESNNLALLNPNEASGTNVTISPSHGPPTASTTFVAATNVTVANPSSTFVSPSITSVQANSLDGFISHAVPTPSSIPNAVAFDSNRNLWFAESQGNNIGVLLRASSQIAEYALPTSNAQFRGKTITIDKSGDVWFVESGSMKLGRLSLSRDIEISIAPSDQTTSIGGEATYSISIRTNSSTYDTITLSLQGLDNSWYSFNRNNFTIVPGETANVQLGVTVPENPENVGTHLFIVTVSSGWTRRTVNGVLHVLLNPIMYDLEPKDNATIGSTDLLISWRTSANATSEVFIKRISEPNFNHTIGGFGKEHYMHVYNLSRNTDYVWYAYSQALSGGNISSNERNLHVSNGITFTQDVYTFNVERDYAQHETVAISDTDSQSHDVKVEALNPYSDLIVGFVGAGSIDRNMTLLPDETKYVDIYIHAQDAQQQNYTFTIKLTNIGIEQIVDYALVELYVRPPNLNLTLIEESIDSTILSKTITARNYGDTITDLYIDTSDELAGKVFFRPTVYHAYVPRGGSLTFEAIPVLTVDFTGCQGHVLATGAGQVIASLQVNFTLPVGKGVFTVRVPEVSIEFSQYYDTDNSPNTNPLPNSPVETYIVNGKRAIASQIIVDVYQNGGPASDAIQAVGSLIVFSVYAQS